MDLSADHLRRVGLYWLDGGDSEVLRTCLSIVSGYSSVEDLKVRCNTPGEHSLVAESHAVHVAPLHKVDIIFLEWLAWQFLFLAQQVEMNESSLYLLLCNYFYKPV